MALVINDRVKETTTTTGTGAVSLGGATTGFEAFSAGVGNSNTTYYGFVLTVGNGTPYNCKLCCCSIINDYGFS